MPNEVVAVEEAISKALQPQPLYDRVLVRRDQEREAAGSGVIVKADAYKEKSLIGTVIAVGEGRVENGWFVPLRVKAGNRVLYGKFAGLDMPEELGSDLIMLREDEILAVL